MSSPAQSNRTPIHTATEVEWRKRLDREARRRLNMSGEDFIAKFRAGGFGDPDDDPNVMWLALLISDEWWGHQGDRTDRGYVQLQRSGR